MNERVKELRKALGLTLETFSARLGVGKTAISKIERGDRRLTDQMFLSICREFNVNEKWLRDGTGEMFIVIPEDEEIIRFAQDLLDNPDDIACNLIKDIIVTYMKLDDTDRAVIQKVINELLDKAAKRKEGQP